jgi:hypothetical protein
VREGTDEGLEVGMLEEAWAGVLFRQQLERRHRGDQLLLQP